MHQEICFPGSACNQLRTQVSPSCLPISACNSGDCKSSWQQIHLRGCAWRPHHFASTSVNLFFLHPWVGFPSCWEWRIWNSSRSHWCLLSRFRLCWCKLKSLEDLRCCLAPRWSRDTWSGQWVTIPSGAGEHGRARRGRTSLTCDSGEACPGADQRCRLDDQWNHLSQKIKVHQLFRLLKEWHSYIFILSAWVLHIGQA